MEKETIYPKKLEELRQELIEESKSAIPAKITFYYDEEGYKATKIEITGPTLKGEKNYEIVNDQFKKTTRRDFKPSYGKEWILGNKANHGYSTVIKLEDGRKVFFTANDITTNAQKRIVEVTGLVSEIPKSAVAGDINDSVWETKSRVFMPGIVSGCTVCKKIQGDKQPNPGLTRSIESIATGFPDVYISAYDKRANAYDFISKLPDGRYVRNEEYLHAYEKALLKRLMPHKTVSVGEHGRIVWKKDKDFDITAEITPRIAEEFVKIMYPLRTEIVGLLQIINGKEETVKTPTEENVTTAAKRVAKKLGDDLVALLNPKEGPKKKNK